MSKVSKSIGAVSALVAALAAAALRSDGRARALTAGLAILAGLLSILAGLFRLGRIASFFSESVLAGFVTGMALTVAIKQVPKMLGIEGGSGNFWERLAHILTNLDETHLLTLVVGLVALALLFSMEHYFHKLPAALIVMLLGIFFSSLFALELKGVHVVGEIPAGLAPPKLPGLSAEQWLLLLPGAFGIALVNIQQPIVAQVEAAAAWKVRNWLTTDERDSYVAALNAFNSAVLRTQNAKDASSVDNFKATLMNLGLTINDVGVATKAVGKVVMDTAGDIVNKAGDVIKQGAETAASVGKWATVAIVAAAALYAMTFLPRWRG